MKFRKLRANEIQVRVAQVSEKYTQLLLYKDARVDMDVLDETVGAEKWQCEYVEVKGNMYCKIGVWCEMDDHAQWIWKSDCGIESRENDGNEKKGEASDAFKRAGFKWGIGRELYTAPKIAVLNEAIGGATSREYQGKKYWNLNNPWQTFYVRELQYDNDGNIQKLRIVNNKGVEVWSNYK